MVSKLYFLDSTKNSHGWYNNFIYLDVTQNCVYLDGPKKVPKSNFPITAIFNFDRVYLDGPKKVPKSNFLITAIFNFDRVSFLGIFLPFP